MYAAVADAYLIAGFVLLVLGVGLTWGIGPACLCAGTMIFCAGGLQARREAR